MSVTTGARRARQDETTESYHQCWFPVALASDVLAGLVPEAEPFPAGGGGLPEGLRHQVGVDVDRSHG